MSRGGGRGRRLAFPSWLFVLNLRPFCSPGVVSAQVVGPVCHAVAREPGGGKNPWLKRGIESECVNYLRQVSRESYSRCALGVLLWGSCFRGPALGVLLWGFTPGGFHDERGNCVGDGEITLMLECH